MLRTICTSLYSTSANCMARLGRLFHSSARVHQIQIALVHAGRDNIGVAVPIEVAAPDAWVFQDISRARVQPLGTKARLSVIDQNIRAEAKGSLPDQISRTIAVNIPGGE